MANIKHSGYLTGIITYKKQFFIIVCVLFLLSVIPAAAVAGEATDRIKNTTDKLIEIVQNKDLDAPEMAEKRARMIRDAVDEVFDWEAFSQRALSRHWRNRTPEEKKEFISLFGKLLERTYMDKTRQYSGEKVDFISEEIDGKYGVVKAVVMTNEKGEVNIEYRVSKEKGTWFVYDVLVEGVSLVNNYRVQFNDIIMRSSYEELVKRLKEKLEGIED